MTLRRPIGRRAIAATILFGIAGLAACTAPAASTPPSPSDVMMEHSPSPSDVMMEHSPSPSDVMMEHSPEPSPS